MYDNNLLLLTCLSSNDCCDMRLAGGVMKHLQDIPEQRHPIKEHENKRNAMLVSTEHTGEPGNPQHCTLGTFLPPEL